MGHKKRQKEARKKAEKIQESEKPEPQEEVVDVIRVFEEQIETFEKTDEVFKGQFLELHSDDLKRRGEIIANRVELRRKINILTKELERRRKEGNESAGTSTITLELIEKAVVPVSNEPETGIVGEVDATKLNEKGLPILNASADDRRLNISYTKEYLLSLSEPESCKTLPDGFNQPNWETGSSGSSDKDSDTQSGNHFDSIELVRKEQHKASQERHKLQPENNEIADKKPANESASRRPNDLLSSIVDNSKPEAVSAVLTCEDLERANLSEMSEGLTLQIPVQRSVVPDGKAEQPNCKVDYHASQHLLSLLQKGTGLKESKLNEPEAVSTVLTCEEVERSIFSEMDSSAASVESPEPSEVPFPNFLRPRFIMGSQEGPTFLRGPYDMREPDIHIPYQNFNVQYASQPPSPSKESEGHGMPSPGCQLFEHQGPAGSDFNPEEEEEVRKENWWAFE